MDKETQRQAAARDSVRKVAAQARAEEKELIIRRDKKEALRRKELEEKRRKARQEAKARRSARAVESKRVLTMAAQNRYADIAFVMKEDTRRVFIDCGYRHGLATKFFKETHPESDKFEYIAFEGNPNLECQDNVIQKAVWIDDCESNFYLGGLKRGEDMSGGSTLIRDKISGHLDKENPIKVECINFSRWLRSSFSKDDYIIVKLNIEGSEYPVIDSMYKDGTLSMVNTFYISWHWRKIGSMTKIDHLRFEKLVPHFAWDLSYDVYGNIDANGYDTYFLETLEKWVQ